MGEHDLAVIKDLFALWPSAVVFTDHDGIAIWANVRAEQLFERPLSDILDQSISSVMQVPNGESLSTHGDAALFCTSASNVGGHPFAVEVFRAPFASGWLWEVRDHTISYHAEGKFRALVEAAPDAMVMIDSRSRVLLVNTAAELLFGYTRQELIGVSLANILPAHAPMVTPTSGDFFSHASSRQFDASLRHKNGSEFFVEVRTSNFDSGGAWRSLVSMRDISQRKALEDRLTHLANYDSLTGLANRNLFLQMLDHALATAHRSGGRFALLFIDLNGFKSVNDQFGHEAGDLLLRLTGERLRAAVREVDTIARLGGDEFTIIVEGVSTTADVLAVVQKILSNLCQRTNLLHTWMIPCAAIGVAIYPDHGASAQELLREADLAMYRAKTLGCPAFAFNSGAIISAGPSLDQHHSLVASDAG